MTGTPDLAIIGAGPAGMAAAVEARRLGLSVAVLDQNPAPGGQVYRAVESAGRGARSILGADYGAGAELVRDFRRSGAEHLAGACVFDIARDGAVFCADDAGARVLRPQRILIATGAMERPVPFPGWTLPGVMTAGAAQTLLKSSALVPAGPVVIAGTGPLAYLLARQLTAAGAEIVALADTADPANRRAARRHLAAAALAGSDLWRGLGWLRDIRRSGLRRITDVRNLRALGEGAVEAVEIETADRRETIRCSLLLVHEGVIPSTHLAMAAGCGHAWNELAAAWETRMGEDGRTSVPTIYAAGDGTGIRGSVAAQLAGARTALAVARDLGRIDAVIEEGEAAALRRRLRRIGKIRRFLDTFYRPRPEVLCPADETLICRCEEVAAGEIREISRLGCQGPNQLKAFCRAGMGACQGRLCGPVIGTLMGEVQRRGVPEVGHLRIRPPVKPVTVGQMAAVEGLADAPSFTPGLVTTLTSNEQS